MDKLGVALAHCESECENFYDAAEVERVFYPEMEKLLLEFFPDATAALHRSRAAVLLCRFVQRTLARPGA